MDMLILSDDFHSYLLIYLKCEKMIEKIKLKKMFEKNFNLKKCLNKKIKLKISENTNIFFVKLGYEESKILRIHIRIRIFENTFQAGQKKTIETEHNCISLFHQWIAKS